MSRNPNQSKGQVERLARSYHRRFRSTLGASLEVEDLTQEFWIVWHRVSQRFDPSLGYDFEALLGVSIRNRAIELAKFYQRRIGVRAVSLDAPVAGDESSDLASLIPSDDETPEENLMRKERASKLMSRMDHRLRHMVEALSDPPEILQREIEALNAKAEMAERMACGAKAQRGINLSMMTEVFGLSRCSRYRLIDEMKEVMAEYD